MKNGFGKTEAYKKQKNEECGLTNEIILNSTFFILHLLSSQHYIQYHHEGETKGEADGAEVGMWLSGGFGN